MVVGCPYVIINTWKPCKIHLSIGTKEMLLWKSSKLFEKKNVLRLQRRQNSKSNLKEIKAY